MLKITLKRSTSGRPTKHKRIVAALGLRKLHQSTLKPDTPVIRGMINKIPHLVEVEENVAENQA